MTERRVSENKRTEKEKLRGENVKNRLRNRPNTLPFWASGHILMFTRYACLLKYRLTRLDQSYLMPACQSGGDLMFLQWTKQDKI